MLETLVIGAGQAGLATSFFLRRAGVEHVVLERGLVGETWRSQRWDGFVLNTPNWATQLPGRVYDGPSPDAFEPRHGVVALLESYARDAPVQTAAPVRRLRPVRRGWVAEVDGDSIEARTVVVATGAFPSPRRPPVAHSIPATVVQLHSSEYRRPDALPDGTVVVVGSGQSGSQIAEELLAAGRHVVVSTGRCGWYPRRYRGRDLIAWAVEMGLMDDAVEAVAPEARRGCNPALSGNNGGHDCHARTLGAAGATLAGRVEGVDDGGLGFADDADDNLAFADEFAGRFMDRIDAHVAKHGLETDEPRRADVPASAPTVTRVGFRELGAIVWATGYGPDFSWIGAPLRDDGWPAHAAGASPAPGLFFVGLPWLRKRKSPLLLGVGEDAEHVVGTLVGASGERTDRGPSDDLPASTRRAPEP